MRTRPPNKALQLTARLLACFSTRMVTQVGNYALNGFRYICLIDNWLNLGVNERQLFILQRRHLYWYNTSILRKMISKDARPGVITN